MLTSDPPMVVVREERPVYDDPLASLRRLLDEHEQRITAPSASGGG